MMIQGTSLEVMIIECFCENLVESDLGYHSAGQGRADL